MMDSIINTPKWLLYNSKTRKKSLNHADFGINLFDLSRVAPSVNLTFMAGIFKSDMKSYENFISISRRFTSNLPCLYLVSQLRKLDWFNINWNWPANWKWNKKNNDKLIKCMYSKIVIDKKLRLCLRFF